MYSYRLRRWLLICVACLALFAGTFWARQVLLLDARWILLVVPLVVISLRPHNVITLLLLALLFFGVGWWRGSSYMQRLATQEALYYQKVTLVGRATDEAVYGKRSQLEFVMSNVRVVEPEASGFVGNVTVRGFGEPAIYRGDTVAVTGKVYPTLGNSVATVSFAELTVVQQGTSAVDEFRRRFAAGMQAALPEPAASFALGLLIGQRTTLPEDIDDQLRHVGLTHIIAVSGYNLTVIVMACRKLFERKSKYQATVACVALITLFLLITGSSPPIVRASIISALGIAAWYYGRTIKPLVLLLVGAAITIVANPMYLWGNVSWYLSFLAFFGVLIIAPQITKRYWKDKEPRLLTAVALESACANIVVLPYILYVFGETSAVGLLANIAVVPLIPLAMVFGLGAGLAGVFVPVWAGWVAWPAKMLLTYMLDIAAVLSKVPHAFIEGVGMSWRLMLASYAIIGLVSLILYLKVRPKANRNTVSNQ